MGEVDNSRPLLFARFTNTTSKRLVARQPITAGALLETTAVHSDIQTQMELIGSIKDPLEARMEASMFQKELERSIYNPALTLYTAPVHTLAFKTKLEAPHEAYAWGARVSQVALNLQPKHFEAMQFPGTISRWSGRFDGFRSACDPGTAFVMICEAGGVRRSSETADQWLARALRILGLGSERAILVEAQMILNNEERSPGPVPLYNGHEYLKTLGNRIAQVRRSHGPALTLSSMMGNWLTLPPMFDRDAKSFTLSARPFDLKQFNPVTMCETEGKLHTWMINFEGACR